MSMGFNVFQIVADNQWTTFSPFGEDLYRYLGYSEQQSQKIDFIGLVHPNDVLLLEKPGDIPPSAEIRFRRADHLWVPFQVKLLEPVSSVKSGSMVLLLIEVKSANDIVEINYRSIIPDLSLQNLVRS